MSAVVLYGAGATARVIAEMLGSRLYGAVTDSLAEKELQNPLLCVVQPSTHLRDMCDKRFDRLLLAIGYQHGGMNRRRQQLYEQLTSDGYSFTRIAPLDLTPRHAELHDGVVILPGTRAHHDVAVLKNCFIGSNVVLGHHVTVQSHAWINSGVCVDGYAIIGPRCVIGANAVISAGVVLGEATLVGPGCVVQRDTEPGTVILPPELAPARFSSDVYGTLQA